ncbi:hypothetical protein A9Q99_26460 [Gammaproteobacteria bacterium 45_16_T64]|nr:hypothetical protein A9Q99_26460 [Gammaproteobacteria bacterium 45_16_T64]
MAAFNSFVRYLPVVGACFLLAGCKPTITFTALESSIISGNSTTLDWEVELAKGAGIRSIEIKPDIGEVGLEGSISVTPEETTTYTLSTQSFAFGFPFFIDEKVTVEVTEGDTWTVNDFINTSVWVFFKAANYVEAEESKYSADLALAEQFGESALQVSVEHDDAELSDGVIVVGTVHKTGLEENTDYEIAISVKYAIGARRDVSDTDCNMPILAVRSYASLAVTETVTVERDGADYIEIEDYDSFTKHEMSADITISDDECGVRYDLSDSIGAVSTGLNPLAVTTDSDGDAYISIVLDAEYANFEIYIISVSASYEEQ